jgi:hypothetical protein
MRVMQQLTQWLGDDIAESGKTAKKSRRTGRNTTSAGNQ